VTGAGPVGTPAAGHLDWASGGPLHPVARAALAEAIDSTWADPDRTYHRGRTARRLLDGSREAVASVLGVRSDEVHFTAGGPTAVQQGLLGLAAAQQRVGRTVVVGAVEHSAVLHAAGWAGERVEVGVDAQGRVSAEAFAAAVAAPGVAVAALQRGNQEVGTLQPVEPAARACAALGVPLLVDLGAAVGRVAVTGTGAGALAVPATAWGGPPGVGVLAVRTGTRWRQPGPPRSDDEPAVPLVAAAAASLLAVEAERVTEAARLRGLTDRLRTGLGVVPDCVVLGDADPGGRLPQLLTVSLLYVDGEELLRGLDAAGLTASSGSACTAETLTPSHVLAAMGALTEGNLRLSLGWGSDAADVDRLLAVLPPLVARLREEAGVTGL